MVCSRVTLGSGGRAPRGPLQDPQLQVQCRRTTGTQTQAQTQPRVPACAPPAHGPQEPPAAPRSCSQQSLGGGTCPDPTGKETLPLTTAQPPCPFFLRSEQRPPRPTSTPHLPPSVWERRAHRWTPGCRAVPRPGRGGGLLGAEDVHTQPSTRFPPGSPCPPSSVFPGCFRPTASREPIRQDSVPTALGVSPRFSCHMAQRPGVP